MRILRRNSTEFTYRKNLTVEEVTADGLHAGNYNAQYGDAVTYRGNINEPTGFAANELFGVNVRYTHVLIMDRPDADIAEDGLVEWKGDTYDVTAVRRSLNVLQAALRKRTKNHPRPTGGD